MRLRGRAARLVRRTVACLAVVGVAACGTGTTSGSAPAPALSDNRYRQVNLAANAEAYQARFTMPEMVMAILILMATVMVPWRQYRCTRKFIGLRTRSLDQHDAIERPASPVATGKPLTAHRRLYVFAGA